MVAVFVPRSKEEEDEDNDHTYWLHPTNDDSSMAPPNPTRPGFPPTGLYPIHSEVSSTTHTSQPLETLQSSYTSGANTPWSENAGITSSPTAVLSGGAALPTTTNSDYGGVEIPQKGQHHSNHGGFYAAAAVVPIVLAILGVAAFFYLRKRRRQRQQAAGGPRGQEMKARPQSTVQPFLAAPPVQPAYTAPPSHPPPTASPTSPQPVILGPIAPTSNGAYYTGIDTSDIVSVNGRNENDRTGLGNPFADASSLNEEPPPPYRPRSLAPSALSRNTSTRTSIAPLSRDTSLRAPAAHSQTNLIERPERSPFADPDDDAVSNASSPTAGRPLDTLSIVSDLSYQQEPRTRPSV